MSRNARVRLGDIVDACSRIAEYIDGFDLAGFAAHGKTQDAVIRQFEIIGEAVKSLSEPLRAKEPEIAWSQIAGFRDVLAHAYFAVESSVVWDAASNKAPALKNACLRLLADESAV